MAAGGGSKAVIAAFLGNSAVAATKFGAWAVTGSSSMLAEAIHSVADAGNQALLLWGSRAARKAPDEEHQFGYGRERYFWSFIVALVLFLLGSVFAIYHGVEKILHPHGELENVTVALVVLALGILIEGFALRTAVVESRPRKGDLSWLQFIRRSRVPELPVVLLEDLGAMIGLVFAFIALVLTKVTHNPLWDGIGSLSIGILMGFIAILLIIEMRSLLIGEGARPDDMAKIRAAIENSPHVQQLVHLRTQHLSPEELLVGAKVVFEPMAMEDLARAINEVEVAVRADVPYATPLYIEPGLAQFEG